MRAHASFLAAAAIAVAVSVGFGIAAEAQPFGRGGGQRVAERAHERNEARREYRQEPRGGYRPPAYAPAPSAPPPAYAYPAPAPAYPYPQRGAPPTYAPQPYAASPAAPPPAYGYAQPPGGGGRNSLGAYWGQQQNQARRGVREGGMVPLGSVLANIRRGTRGRILDAGIEPGPDGRPVYRVRWAAEGGRRIDFIVDATTGAIIGQTGY